MKHWKLLSLHSQKILKMENSVPRKRNLWQLVLGILFLSYGCYRLYRLSSSQEDNTLGLILAVGFIAYGIYDLYKYYKGV